MSSSGDAWQKVADIPTPFKKYKVSVEGLERVDGTWAGRLIFDDGNDRRVTGQETSQPNRRAVEYWASGLEPIFLDGALKRAK